jgi:hypothetical protein
VPFAASTAASTTELTAFAPVQYLAVWRLLPQDMAEDDPVWQMIRKVAAPGPAYLYVPAFSLARSIVQRLGVRLTEVQPVLELTSQAPAGRGPRPALAEARPNATPFPGAAAAVASSLTPGDDAFSGPAEGNSSTVSPILVGRREAWALALFIYMAIEAREIHDLRPIDLRLTGQEELLFLPAVWDPRYIHESNWRLLLREFDGLVA